MSSVAAIPPLRLIDPSDDPEHYEFLNGHWEKKESVGREEHSRMGRVMRYLLRDIARQLGSKVEQEWTVLGGERKIIPDVTLSLPAPLYKIADGYLVAPALLAVESRSKGQRLQKLVDKCIHEHHPMGTRYCWIIDIEKQVAYECHAERPEAVPVSALSFGTEHSFSLPVDRLFEQFRAADV